MFPLHDSIPATKTPFITWAIIVANVWIFYLELSGGQAFIEQYAFIPERIDFADIATLFPFITAMFLHGGWLHLISNMWFLRIFGDNVEARLGHVRFLIFYLAAGIAATLTQYLFAPQSAIPMIGASGAIAGVLGAYFIFFRHATITSFIFLGFYITVLDIPAILYLPYWFLLQLLSGINQVSAGTIASTGGVAFLAHAGGFVAGIIGARLARPHD